MDKIKVKELPEKIKILGVVKSEDPLEEKLEDSPDFSENFSPLMESSSPSLPSSDSVQSIEDIPEIRSEEFHSEEQKEIKGQTYVASSQNVERERRRYQQSGRGQAQPTQIQSQSFSTPQSNPDMFRPQRVAPLSETIDESIEKKYDVHSGQVRERRKLPWEI